MTEQSCVDCRYAEWKRTAAGRLHPSGEGRCVYTWESIVLPVCYHWERRNLPRPTVNGKPGLDRHRAYTDCPCWDTPKAR